MTSRKHYRAFAEVIAGEIKRAQYDPADEKRTVNATASRIARALADIFAGDNPNFDRERFFYACTLDENGR